MRHLLFCFIAGLISAGSTLGGPPVSGPATAAGASASTVTLGPGEGTGLTGSYFNNGSLAGAPLLRRVDAVVDFEWKESAPAAGVRNDNFSVRWEGQVEAPATGRYRFMTVSNDGVRLWINGKQVIDNWTDHNTTTNSGTEVNMAAGERTSIKLEYYDQEGDATIRLQWVRPGKSGGQTVPSVYLYPLEGPDMPVAAPVTLVAASPEPAPSKSEAKKAAAAAAAKTAAAAAATEPSATTATTTEKPKTAKPVKPTKVAKVPKPVTPVEEPKVAVAKTPATETPMAENPVAEAPVADQPSADAAGVLSVPGVYTLLARSDGKPLKVEGEAPVSREPGLAVTPSGPPQWKIEEAGSGYYKLTVQGGRKVLEVLGSSTSNGAPMSLWPYYSGNNQLWKIEDAGQGYYKLVAKHSKKALTAGTEEEGGLQQRRYASRLTQQWKLQASTDQTRPIVGPVENVPVKGANRLSVYPNPSNGVIQMAYQLGEAQPIGWVLYTQDGAAVRVSDYQVQRPGQHHETIDFTGLPAGDYNLNLTVGTTTTRQQLSIRRPSNVPVEPEVTGATK